MTQTKEIKGFVAVVGKTVECSTFSAFTDQVIANVNREYTASIPPYQILPATLTVEVGDEQQKAKWVCDADNFVSDPAGSARCGSCGKRRHEHPSSSTSGAE